MRAAVLSALAAGAAAGLSCLDESGQPVDWFAVFKWHGSLDYAYVDSNTPVGTGPLQLTGKSVGTTDSAVGATIEQLYTYNGQVARIMWNDEPVTLAANETSGLRGSRRLQTPNEDGHTKGVIGADANGGFWMIHSVPLWPNFTNFNTYTWTESNTYSQSFLCVSVNELALEDVASNLLYMDPWLYDSMIPDSLQTVYPVLSSLLAGNRMDGTSIRNILSRGGLTLNFFSKSCSWDNDLYEYLVQPFFATKWNAVVPFAWETWRRSPAEPSFCGGNYSYPSLNVNYLQMLDSSGAMQAYKYTQDHSKYGISLSSNPGQQVVCIGGINRMWSQWQRGGGTACFVSEALYNRISQTFTQIDPCSA